MESPIGPILLEADAAALLKLRLLGSAASAPAAGDRTHPILAAALDQLFGWFAGHRQHFDLPLVPLAQA